VKKINQINLNKKKKTKVRKISFFDVWASSNLCFIKRDRLDILKKLQELIDELMDIGYISHKLLEINYMKSIIFDERENMIFNYQKKRSINISNRDFTNNYINSLMDFCDEENFNIESYEKIENKENNRKEKILDFMRNY
jgi:hypothetical protein